MKCSPAVSVDRAVRALAAALVALSLAGNTAHGPGLARAAGTTRAVRTTDPLTGTITHTETYAYFPSVAICWVHYDDHATQALTSRLPAMSMVSGYHIVYPPAVFSRHTQRLAIDMTITMLTLSAARAPSPNRAPVR